MKRFVKLLTVLTVMALCLAGAAAAENEPAPAEEYGLYLTVSAIDEAGITVDVCMDVDEDTTVGAFSICVSYSENMTLVNCETACVAGAVADKPFTLKWSGGEGETLPAGDNVIASLSFEIEGNVREQTFTASASFAEVEPPTDPAGESLADKIAVQPGLTFTFAEVAPALLCPASVGDANGDGKVNLMDVSLMLKNIAGWTDAVLEGDLGDVVNDGKINLNDVSLMLKHIAGWNSVRLGHNDKADVIKAPTCQEEGESHLTCEVCGSEETVHPPKVPCDYRRSVVTEPTCGKDGEDKYTCIMCGDAYTRVVKATGDHQYDKKVTKEPTCVKKGLAEYTCTVCGDSYKDILPMKTTHDYAYGFCTVCEKEHPDYAGRANEVKLREYCDWLLENGMVSDYGDYSYVGYTGEWYFISTYYPEYDSFTFTSTILSEDETLQFIAIIEILLNKQDITVDFKHSYKYTFYLLDADGYEHVFFDGFIDPVHLKTMDWALAVNSWRLPSDDGELLRSCNIFALDMLRESAGTIGYMFELSGVDITAEDLSFKGY